MYACIHFGDIYECTIEAYPLVLLLIPFMALGCTWVQLFDNRECRESHTVYIFVCTLDGDDDAVVSWRHRLIKHISTKTPGPKLVATMFSLPSPIRRSLFNTMSTVGLDEFP